MICRCAWNLAAWPPALCTGHDACNTFCCRQKCKGSRSRVEMTASVLWVERRADRLCEPPRLNVKALATGITPGSATWSPQTPACSSPAQLASPPARTPPAPSAGSPAPPARWPPAAAAPRRRTLVAAAAVAAAAAAASSGWRRRWALPIRLSTRCRTIIHSSLHVGSALGRQAAHSGGSSSQRGGWGSCWAWRCPN